MRKGKFLKTALFSTAAVSAILAVACGGSGSSNTTGQSTAQSQPTRKGEVVINNPVRPNRFISQNADALWVKLVSYPNNYSNPIELKPVMLTPDKRSYTFDILAGGVTGILVLLNNSTGKYYPIEGTYFEAYVNPGESKQITVYMPNGIWSLTQTIKDISKIQLGEFPTKEVIKGFPAFDASFYDKIASSKDFSQAKNLLYADLLINGTVVKAEYVPAPEGLVPQAFQTFVLEPTNNNQNLPLIFGIFNEDGKSATLFAADKLECNLQVNNQTISTTGENCLALIPVNTDLPQSGTYTVQKKICLEYYNDTVDVRPAYECDENGEIYKNITVNYNFTNLEKTTVNISDLPLPWKDLPKLSSLNVTCDSTTCTFNWSIENPQNHPLKCELVAISNGNIAYNKTLDCTAGSAVIDRQTDVDPVNTNTYFIVKDEAFVQPMTVVKWINPNEINVQGAKTITFNIGLENVYVALLDDNFNVIRLAKSDENGQVTINNIETAKVNIAAIVTPEVVVPKDLVFKKLLVDYLNWYIQNNTQNNVFTGDTNIVTQLNNWLQNNAIPKTDLEEFVKNNPDWNSTLDLSQITTDNVTADDIYNLLTQTLDKNGDGKLEYEEIGNSTNIYIGILKNISPDTLNNLNTNINYDTGPRPVYIKFGEVQISNTTLDDIIRYRIDGLTRTDNIAYYYDAYEEYYTDYNQPVFDNRTNSTIFFGWTPLNEANGTWSFHLIDGATNSSIIQTGLNEDIVKVSPDEFKEGINFYVENSTAVDVNGQCSLWIDEDLEAYIENENRWLHLVISKHDDPSYADRYLIIANTTLPKYYSYDIGCVDYNYGASDISVNNTYINLGELVNQMPKVSIDINNQTGEITFNLNDTLDNYVFNTYYRVEWYQSESDIYRDFTIDVNEPTALNSFSVDVKRIFNLFNNTNLDLNQYVLQNPEYEHMYTMAEIDKFTEVNSWDSSVLQYFRNNPVPHYWIDKRSELNATAIENAANIAISVKGDESSTRSIKPNKSGNFLWNAILNKLPKIFGKH